MKRLIYATIFLAVPVIVLAGQQQSHFEIVEIAPGVHAALQPDRYRFQDSNSVFIVNASDVLVVDAQANPADTRKLIAAIKGVTDKPVRQVVLTHAHSDHLWSFPLYREAYPAGVDMIAHQTVLEAMAASREELREQVEGLREALPGAKEQLATGTNREGEPLTEEQRADLQREIPRAEARLGELEKLELLPPSWTFERKLVLHRGPRTIELHHFRGHTEGDVVVYLPEEGIVITGDLLDDMPYGGKSFPEDWVASLDELGALEFEVIVPGHGALHHGKDHLLLVRELLQWITTGVKEGLSKGRRLEAIRAEMDGELTAFRERLAGGDELKQRVFDAFIPGTIERSFELRSSEVEPR